VVIHKSRKSMSHEPDVENGKRERFDYFMVRLSRTDREPERLAGLIERLGSGEKRSFETGEQLIRLVGGWGEVYVDVQPAGEKAGSE
jgi:hypothetical protein